MTRRNRRSESEIGIRRDQIATAIATEIAEFTREFDGSCDVYLNSDGIPEYAVSCYEPEEDANQAFEAMEILCERTGYSFDGLNYSQYIKAGYDCNITKGKSWLGETCVGYKGTNESPAMAICLAMLSASRSKIVVLDK